MMSRQGNETNYRFVLVHLLYPVITVHRIGGIPHGAGITPRFPPWRRNVGKHADLKQWFIIILAVVETRLLGTRDAARRDVLKVSESSKFHNELADVSRISTH